MTLALMAALAASLSPTSPATRQARVLMVTEAYPGSSAAFRTGLTAALRSAGLDPVPVRAEELGDRLNSETGQGAVLILPDATRFPAAARDPLLAFLKRRNHLLCVSGPAFGRMVSPMGGKWVDREQMREALAQEPGRSIIEFQPAATLFRASGDARNPATHQVEPGAGPDGHAALHVRLSKLETWDTINMPGLGPMFTREETVTTFWAKGGPDTRELALEWCEKDGSRWVAVVQLGTRWKRYALLPEDFALWPDGSPADRGKPGDRPKLGELTRIAFIIANGQTKQKMGIPHEYWVSDIRAAVRPNGGVDDNPPLLETLSPQYKLFETTPYRCTEAGTPAALPAGSPVICAVTRSPGYGTDTPEGRFVPVLSGYRKGEPTPGSAPAHLYINGRSAYAGSIWGSLGFGQQHLQQHPAEYARVAAGMVKRMVQGAALLCGGAGHIAYLPGETMKLAATLVGTGAAPGKCRVECRVTGVAKATRTRTVAVNGNSPTAVDLGAVKPTGIGTARVTITVSDAAGARLDRISYTVRILADAGPNPAALVRASGGQFTLGGRPWYAFGMNYWPLYSIGREPDAYWLHWLTPDQYDPDAVERDLVLAEKLGMNLVSIQYGRVDQARPLLDFLARCDAHHIKAHVFLPHLDPANPNPGPGLEMIRAAHLANSSALFAYDLAWEVHVGFYEARKQYDRAWQDWVVDRYGSVEAAIRDWKYQPKVVQGVITGPTDDQLKSEGDWRIYVSAYRRFWDDRYSKGYQVVTRAVRSVDPNHLMGARSGWGGLGGIWPQGGMPIDLLTGARHLDFVSPEGYAIGGDRKGFLRGGFDNAYARYWSGGKPIYWAEFGSPLFFGISSEAYRLADSSKGWDVAAAYYKGLLEMVVETGANGAAGWWWPAGYRVDEKSDFGVVGQDGAPRPPAAEFGKIAARFHAARPTPVPDTYITVDRDKHSTGFAGVYEECADQWVEAFLAGKQPGIRTEATGTSSADTPLVAVGNLPCNGSNPPRYLNSEFNSLQVNRREVANGDLVEVAAGTAVRVTASVGNIAEATWLKPTSADSQGGVYLLATWEGGEARFPIAANTPFRADVAIPEGRLPIDTGEVTVTFRMEARGRTPFGEVARVRIRRI